MVGRTYWKTVFRSVKKSLGRFLALAAIVALGVGFLVGLLTATPDLKKSVDAYYRERDFADFFLKSAALFTEEDVRAVAGAEGVAAVLPLSQTDVLASAGSTRLTTRVVAVEGLGERLPVNDLELLSGRFPQSDGECVAERAGTYLTALPEGVRVNYEVGGISRELTVVGTVANAAYFSREQEPSSAGAGRLECIVYAPPAALPLPEGFYTDILVRAADTSGATAFSARYDKKTEPVKEALEALAADREGWYVLGRDANVSYVSFEGNADKVAAIARIFPAFFFLVAALIALTTMTRMVEEERPNIGTLKALGFGKGAIVGKFLVYSGLATLAGIALGELMGFWLLPMLIYETYDTIFHMPAFVMTIDWLAAAAVPLAMAACTLLPAGLSCVRSLRERPAELMRPRAPKPGKRILLERVSFVWKRLSFRAKATCRNIFRYKKHLFMTVFGVAGCTALMLTGFGLRDSLYKVTEEQFGAIVGYDVRVTAADADALEQIASGGYFGASADMCRIVVRSGTLSADGNSRSLTVYAGAPGTVDEFVRLKTRGDKEKIPFDGDSAVLTERIALEYGIEPGDEVTLEAAGVRATFAVTHLTENYVGSAMYLGDGLFARLFGSFEPDSLLVREEMSEEEQGALARTLLSEGLASGVEFSSRTRESYAGLIRSVDFIVVILILAAGALAAIVIYNLTNINITARTKEIATLKVLGYRRWESAMYILREILILTVIGICAGLGLGTGLHAYVMRAVDSIDMMLGRNIFVQSFFYSAGLSLAFAVLVDGLMVIKMNRIDMAESMKAVE